MVYPKARLLICFNNNYKYTISPNRSYPTNHLRDKYNIPLSRQKDLSKACEYQRNRRLVDSPNNAGDAQTAAVDSATTTGTGACFVASSKHLIYNCIGDAKHRERLIGMRFNKKLGGFLYAIWHYEDLANSPPIALGAYPIKDATRASIYKDLGEVNDDSEEEDDNSDISSASDDDNGDNGGDIFSPSYDKNEEGNSANRPK
ncbi:hypothetical protein HZ326_22724 [Fusarium oxysporum f. sp. albedinis]|nr:hypothetical protein HZ326_22724 [Fusarium oxysporum f. sp. albedinis]